MLALPRPVAFAGCCIVAALNARMAPVAATIQQLGAQNAFFNLFEISAVIWFALYAAWTIAYNSNADEPYRRGDGPILAAMVVAILLPMPILSIGAGFAAGLWLLLTSQSGTSARRLAIIVTALTAQQIFGRLFLALFSEFILAADIILVELLSGLESHGNVVTRADGSELIVAAGCSSVRNLSYALLAWVTVAQLFRLRLDKRLIMYVAASMLAIFLLNSLRLFLMAWFPVHFEFLHEGSGAALFGWTGFLILAALAGAAVLALAPRKQAVPA